MRGGAWPREMLTQCLGKTLGVFGTGTIGARVIALAKALGMEVLAWSARGDESHIRSLGAQPAAKDEILKQADFVILHLRLTPGDARLPHAPRARAHEEDGDPHQHRARARWSSARRCSTRSGRDGSPAPASTSSTRSR